MRPSANFPRELGWLERSARQDAAARPRSLHKSRRPHKVRQPDPLQFDPHLLERTVHFLDPIVRYYFRGEVRGLENVPAGQSLIVANHDSGMLPIDGVIFASAWHKHFGYKRPMHVLVHDILLKLLSPWGDAMAKLGLIHADRSNLDAVLDAGHSVLLYPGGSREAFRSYWERKTLTLGLRTGFIKHALRRNVPITPVISVGAHETFVVLWPGSWLAEKLGFSRLFRADVFPIVAGLPFGIWLGAVFPQLPLPTKITVSVLPPIDLHAEVTARLGRELRDSDLEDEALLRRCFDRVRVVMQREMDRLYAERRYPILG